MDNYDYCAGFVIGAAPSREIVVLDYGCGSGQIVTALRGKQIEAYGCEVFYGGGDTSKSIPNEMLGTTIREMQGSRIPFPDASFDFVINNQVMEHVENLDTVLSEIHRVLKPGGKVLSLFPDRSVWREGHCGIPFLHWFKKGSDLRVYYAAFLRLLGLGYYTTGKGVLKWSDDFCDWLDKWTWYRSYADIRQGYERYFTNFEHIEDEWLLTRYADKFPPIEIVPTRLQRFVVRKLAGLVFVCSKPA